MNTPRKGAPGRISFLELLMKAKYIAFEIAVAVAFLVELFHFLRHELGR
jgi:hypothetical protein